MHPFPMIVAALLAAAPLAAQSPERPSAPARPEIPVVVPATPLQAAAGGCASGPMPVAPGGAAVRMPTERPAPGDPMPNACAATVRPPPKGRP